MTSKNKSNMALDLSKLNVLIVEDTLPMAKLLASVLGTLGIKDVSIRNNAVAGFDTFCKTAPDIIFVDWEMEPMNGIELTRLIRRSPQSPNRMTPIILVTGYSALVRVAEARDAGVTEFLVKPFSANDIAKRVSYVVNKPRDFVDLGEAYFGPDRRRRKVPNYNGPFRREKDPANLRMSSEDALLDWG